VQYECDIAKGATCGMEVMIDKVQHAEGEIYSAWWGFASGTGSRTMIVVEAGKGSLVLDEVEGIVE